MGSFFTWFTVASGSPTPRAVPTKIHLNAGHLAQCKVDSASMVHCSVSLDGSPFVLPCVRSDIDRQNIRFLIQRYPARSPNPFSKSDANSGSAQQKKKKKWMQNSRTIVRDAALHHFAASSILCRQGRGCDRVIVLTKKHFAFTFQI